jgi:signal transduction histidine kinase
LSGRLRLDRPVAWLAAAVLVVGVVEIALLLWGPPGKDVWAGALAVVQVVLVLAMLRRGFARPGGVEELGAWLSADDDDRRTDLATALAGWLGDESLRVVYWVAELGAYVDAAGSEVALPPAGSDRAAVEVALGEQRVGAIVYDATRIARPELVRAGGRVVALALDNERLAAELLASSERVRQSRARIVEAADSERRRIARDLHDGLQARLVLLAILADRVRAEAIPAGEPSRHAAELHDGLQTAITELRELVHGVVPAALTERGLYAAIREQAYRVPIAIELELDGDDPELSELLESTGYFVASEALANSVKHSRATKLTVHLSCADGRLRIEIGDDGVGGAHVGGGGGIRGIIDRVEALDGEVTVRSPPGGGTQILAEIPLVS